jgi:hypothetical protein
MQLVFITSCFTLYKETAKFLELKDVTFQIIELQYMRISNAFITSFCFLGFIIHRN